MDTINTIISRGLPVSPLSAPGTIYVSDAATGLLGGYPGLIEQVALQDNKGCGIAQLLPFSTGTACKSDLPALPPQHVPYAKRDSCQVARQKY